MSTQAHWNLADGGTACAVDVGTETWPVDIEKEAGGDGKHPDPHDLLDAALAACTTLTLQLYVKHKGYAVQSLHVEVSHEGDATPYRMTRTISFVGQLDEEQQASLLRIANKCPVHKTLTGEVFIDTAMASRPAA